VDLIPKEKLGFWNLSEGGNSFRFPFGVSHSLQRKILTTKMKKFAANVRMKSTSPSLHVTGTILLIDLSSGTWNIVPPYHLHVRRLTGKAQRKSNSFSGKQHKAQKVATRNRIGTEEEGLRRATIQQPTIKSQVDRVSLRPTHRH
jgi:hypothetical protein